MESENTSDIEVTKSSAFSACDGSRSGNIGRGVSKMNYGLNRIIGKFCLTALILVYLPTSGFAQHLPASASKLSAVSYQGSVGVLRGFLNQRRTANFVRQDDLGSSPHFETPIGRIIGGRDAARGEFEEYTLILVFDDRNELVDVCGGVVISVNKVLTTASCASRPARSYDLLRNFYSFADEVGTFDFIGITDVARHPRYSSNTLEFNVAVLTMDSGIILDFPKIHRGISRFHSDVATVIGSGLVESESARRVPNLQKTEAPIISNAECNTRWDKQFGVRPVSRDMMCAGFITDARGPCVGDVGGPLYNDINGERVLVGLVSFTAFPCEANRGTQIYTRLASVEPFIKQHAPEAEFKVSGVVPIGSYDVLFSEPFTYERSDLSPPIPEQFEGKYYITFESSEGYLDHPKTEWTFTQRNSNLSFRDPTARDGLLFEIDGAGVTNRIQTRADEINLLIRTSDTPESSNRLFRGRQTSVSSSGSFSDAALGFSSFFSGCFSIGEFEVFEVKYTDGEVSKVVADFSLECQQDQTSLVGSIYYDASLDDAEFVRAPAPPELELDIPSAGSFRGTARIQQRDASTGEITFDQSITSESANFLAEFFPKSSFQAKVRLNLFPNVSGRIYSDLATDGFDIDTSDRNIIEPGFYGPGFLSPASEPSPSIALVGDQLRDPICSNYSGSANIHAFELGVDDVVNKYVFGMRQHCVEENVINLLSVHYDRSIPLPEFVPAPVPVGPIQPELPSGTHRSKLRLDKFSDGVKEEIANVTSEDTQISLFNSLPTEDRKQLPRGTVQTRVNMRTVTVGITGGYNENDLRTPIKLFSGAYPEIAKHAFAPLPLLNVSLTNVECSGAEGNFNIYEVEYGENGLIEKFVFDFSKTCAENSDVYQGSFFYDASLPE